ncbi:hypothetical protein [Marinifilum sp. D714]|uniref:hypothetical protein n=1 Tax=Marinifilum sp. D714 TaxID=2937523 RepID=UPI0027CA72EB|nr:hypothetical protein [Marinifilum sp. D714]MDQ2178053.1 hypothetical protein [Marinifilum sp. D714]
MDVEVIQDASSNEGSNDSHDHVDEKSLSFAFNDNATQPAGNDSYDNKENVGHDVAYWFFLRYEKICKFLSSSQTYYFYPQAG